MRSDKTRHANLCGQPIGRLKLEPLGLIGLLKAKHIETPNGIFLAFRTRQTKRKSSNKIKETWLLFDLVFRNLGSQSANGIFPITIFFFFPLEFQVTRYDHIYNKRFLQGRFNTKQGKGNLHRDLLISNYNANISKKAPRCRLQLCSCC